MSALMYIFPPPLPPEAPALEILHFVPLIEEPLLSLPLPDFEYAFVLLGVNIGDLLPYPAGGQGALGTGGGAEEMRGEAGGSGCGEVGGVVDDHGGGVHRGEHEGAAGGGRAGGGGVQPCPRGPYPWVDPPGGLQVRVGGEEL